MRRQLLALTLILGIFHALNCGVAAQEIKFAEKYALSNNRGKTLEQLVPGTREYYYFHAVEYLNTGNYAEVERLLKNWSKRFGEYDQVQSVQNRLALLRYETEPEKTLEFLQERLGLSFSHQREIPVAQRGLATELDGKLIDPQKLLARYFSNRNDTKRLTDQGLELVAYLKLNENQRRSLLERVRYPDFPNIVNIAAAELNSRRGNPFGRYPVHLQFTLEQLDDLLEKVPALRNQDSFVNLYISKLRPTDDVNWRADSKLKREYLEQLWDRVRDLDPKFNSLKACVLFRLLELNLNEKKFDRPLFVRYLKLPRRVSYIKRSIISQIRSNNHFVQLGTNFSSQTQLAPVSDDEQLVRDYLQQFLKNANSEQEFRPYIESNYLKRQFAIAKILSGQGDVERWASMLSPEQYQSVVSRVDLEFDSTNKEFFDVRENVELKLIYKNVPKLIVKVFEINTFNYYRKFKREIDTDINLDGLVPNFEQTYEYTDAPALQKTATFKFDQIKKRGVYIVDFIGNGKSSRALIRKGRLSLIPSTNVAGHGFKAINEEATVIDDADIWVQGRRYKPGEDGLMVVPFSTSPGRTPIVVSQGDFSCLEWFQHRAETYQLSASMVVDRESLVRSNKAKLLIRPRLLVSGTPIDFRLLRDVALTVTSTDHEGKSASKQFKDIELGLNAETIVEFVTPARLRNLAFQLTAKVQNVSRNVEQTLTVNEAMKINEIDHSDEIQDLHLVPHDQGYALEVLGKSGETRPGQAVQVELNIRGFTQPVKTDLQSNKEGLIQLGKLTNVSFVKAKLAGGSSRSWSITPNSQTNYRTIHANKGDSITLPTNLVGNEVKREDVSLFEVRDGKITHDRFDRLSVSNGMLSIDGLSPGNYRLRLKKQNRLIDIRLTDGKPVDNVLVGDYRHLDMRSHRKLHIESVRDEKEQIDIQLRNANPWTRVHVIASRYQPRFDAYGKLSSISDVEPWSLTPALRRSLYMAGRKIGDEYQYILDRKYADRFPGNMLERPSLLINPWMLRETNNESEQLNSGGKFESAGNDVADSRQRKRTQVAGGNANSDFANLDFLAEGSIVIPNLQPGKDGTIKLDKALLGDRQFVRVISADAFSTAERTVKLSLQNKSLRDLRLANVMDPQAHFSLARQVDLLSKGDEFKIEDILSSKFQAYDDLGDVFKLLNTATPQAKLGKFQFILEWPSFDDDKKNTLFSEHACHELNFFLYKKDPKFFDQVVAKHLANKRNKTFMDRWLLDMDLTQFTRPWSYARLNIFERILLAQRLEGRATDIRRNVDETYLLSPTRRERFGQLFDDALVDMSFESRFETQKASASPELATRGQDLGRSTSRQPSEKPSGGLPFGGGGGGTGGRLGRLSMGVVPAQSNARGFVPPPSSNSISTKRTDDDSPVDQESLDEVALVEQAGEVDRFYEIRGRAKALYRRISTTKEWVESHYWHIPLDKQNPQLVAVNQFWRDYAKHERGNFLSPYFVEANRTFTEMMMAISVLDLPFEEPKHEFVYEDAEMTMKTAGPVIALHQQLQSVALDQQNTKVLISENFFQKDDRHRFEDGVKFDKFITDKFVAHTLYGGQVVVTNPTSTPQSVDILLQVPQGAVVASSSEETKSVPKMLGAFSTETFEYFFYFPAAGEFTHYPAHVSAKEKVLAVADPVNFVVSDVPAEVDKTSWAYVSQNGTDEEVLQFLDRENILRLDLDRIAFRMKAEEVFGSVVRLLRDRQVYNHVLWSYSIRHNDVEAMQEFLSNEDRIVQACGRNFQSKLLTIDPVERSWYYHREYWPLINARTHQVGKTRKILNPAFNTQYHQLMDVLANQPKLDDDDHLVVTYYLLLQDRIGEALERFKQIDQGNIEAKMQYAYCDAYLDMYREKPEEAAAKAEKWADYPVVHWRNKFRAILAQVDEIRGGDTDITNEKDNSQVQTAMAAEAESFDFEMEARQGKIRYQNLDQVTINFYEMDIELLFSRTPFARDDLDGFSMIRPNYSQRVELKSAKDGGPQVHTFDLPAELGNKNVLVEIVAGDQAKSKPYYSNSLNVQLVETYGQLRVTDSESQKALPKTYVKVYARHADGKIKFHKDGYTDLRGRFDYVTQSNNQLDSVTEYSVLIMHPENGAIVRKAMPPKE